MDRFTILSFTCAVSELFALDDLQAAELFPILFVEGVGDKLYGFLKTRNHNVLKRVGALLRFFD